MKTKQCSKCSKFKELNSFAADKSKRDGKRSWCKACRKPVTAKWHADNKEAETDKNLKLKYGITLTKYKEMLEKQNNLCAVCNNPEIRKNHAGKIKSLSVDHCHATGKVRALLCSDCNLAEGYLKSNSDIARKLADYIDFHNEK